MNTITPTKYYTVIEVAALLGCTPQTVRNYVKNGTINVWATKQRTYGHRPLVIKGTEVQKLYNS